jgi:hypothetical protein
VLAALHRWLAARFAWQHPTFIDFAVRYVLTGSLDDTPSEFRAAGDPRDIGHEDGAAFFRINTITDLDFYRRLRWMDWVAHRTVREQKLIIPAKMNADLEFMLCEGIESLLQGTHVHGKLSLNEVQQPDAFVFNALYQAVTRNPHGLLKRLFFYPRRRGIRTLTRNWNVFLFDLPRFDELLVADWEVLFQPDKNGERLLKPKLIYALGRVGLGTGAKRDEFLGALLGSGEENRRAARAALTWCDGTVVRDYASRLLSAGSPDQRAEAADLLWHLDGEAVRLQLRDRLVVERHPVPRERLARLVGLEQVVAATAEPAVPDFPRADMAATVPAALRDWLRGQRQALNATSGRSGQPLSEADIELLFKVMDGRTAEGEATHEHRVRVRHALHARSRILQSFGTHPDMPLACVLRANLCYAYQDMPLLGPQYAGFRFEDEETPYLAGHPTDLRTLADAHVQLGGQADDIGTAVLQTPVGSRLLLPAELIGPFFAERLHLLEEALAVKIQPRPEVHDRALTVLETMPDVPARLVPRLLEIAFDSHLVYRDRAQAMLGRMSGIRTRVEEALRHSFAGRRAIAARWLERAAWPEAVPALVAALERERSGTVRTALVAALEACGHHTGGLFDLDTQLHEAEQLLARDGLRPLDWFPWHCLPTVRRADGNGDLPPSVLQGWLVRSLHARTPGGSSELRHRLAAIQTEDRPALARAILSAWLERDREEQAATDDYGRKRREHYDALMQRRCLGGLTPAQVMQKLHFNSVNPPPAEPEPVGVGVTGRCRGILGVAAVCGDETLVPLARPALKAWDGSKRHHIIALLEMLAAIDHPSAIQAVLACATRHPVRTVRESAAALVKAIAQAKGWTTDELADRTVPTGGLGDDGTLTLDFGPRAFTLGLDDDLAPVLRNAAGKVLKALPKPCGDDDPEKAVTAKSALAAARKELKTLLPQQTARLYEAMCLERSWPVEDWRRTVAAHPILGRIAQRLVWAARDGAEMLFRPLADGSLTDADDNAVTLPEGATVRLAHAVTAGAAAAAAWLGHLNDYEVVPLFAQFGRPVPVVSDGQASFADAVGVMLSSLKLRRVAEKLGYQSGPTVDNGWYHGFVRACPTLGLEACLLFSGCGCGHDGEDRSVALKQAGFQPLGTAYPGTRCFVPLDRVPRPLAAELYADLLGLAALGAFDAAWERKVDGI